MRVLRAITGVLKREPVALGAAALAWFAVWVDPNSATYIAASATVAWAQRAMSTPKAAVDEKVAEAVDAKEAEVQAFLEGAKQPARRARKT